MGIESLKSELTEIEQIVLQSSLQAGLFNAAWKIMWSDGRPTTRNQVLTLKTKAEDIIKHAINYYFGNFTECEEYIRIDLKGVFDDMKKRLSSNGLDEKLAECKNGQFPKLIDYMESEIANALNTVEKQTMLTIEL